MGSVNLDTSLRKSFMMDCGTIVKRHIILVRRLLNTGILMAQLLSLETEECISHRQFRSLTADFPTALIFHFPYYRLLRFTGEISGSLLNARSSCSMFSG